MGEKNGRGKEVKERNFVGAGSLLLSLFNYINALETDNIKPAHTSVPSTGFA
jgi:hypothetical protein